MPHYPKPKCSKIFCLSALFRSLSLCVLPWVLNCQSGHYFGALHGHAGKVGSVGRMNSQTNMWLSPTGMEKKTPPTDKWRLVLRMQVGQLVQQQQLANMQLTKRIGVNESGSAKANPDAYVCCLPYTRGQPIIYTPGIVLFCRMLSSYTLTQSQHHFLFPSFAALPDHRAETTQTKQPEGVNRASVTENINKGLIKMFQASLCARARPLSLR